MFAVVAELEKSGRCTVDLTHDSRADLLGEFRQWLGIMATSQEGPWERAPHFSATLKTDRRMRPWSHRGAWCTRPRAPSSRGEASRQTGWKSISTRRRCTASTTFYGSFVPDTRTC